MDVQVPGRLILATRDRRLKAKAYRLKGGCLEFPVRRRRILRVMMTKQRVTRILPFALLLTGIWYLLSGKLDVLHFGTGVVAALVIAANFAPTEDRTRFAPARFVLYVPWLMWQILVSNLRVARMVLSRRMRIAPMFISQKPGAIGVRALTMLGSSITLTPGTLTVDMNDDEIFVHALDRSSERDIRANVIARRVMTVFPERADS